MMSLLRSEVMKGFKISRGESQADFTDKGLSLAVNLAAKHELLGTRSRDACISGQHDF